MLCNLFFPGETVKRTAMTALFATTLSIALSAALGAQTKSDLAALAGLAPQASLDRTDAGRAALGANFTVTGGIQNGVITQPTLLPFAEQQQQALRDVSITEGNLTQLADGLGTALGSAYIARAHYISRTQFTRISDDLTHLIAYANATSGANSNAGKFFFANATTNGTAPVSDEAMKLLTGGKESTDAFGRAYNLPAGSPGGDKYGDSRPFQTEPHFLSIVGRDYFGTPADNYVYNRGPMMNLTNSPSFPSGHTTYGYTGAMLLAILVPERYPQMVVRGAEYGNDRIIAGAHYAMDVLGGRTLALYDLAHLLANDPDYVNQHPRKTAPITDFRAAMLQARAEVVKVLEAGCGKPVAECALEDTSRFSDAAINNAFYASTQTYGLPVVHPQNAHIQEDVNQLAPEAGYLLTVAFPKLSLQEANRILTETEGPGGGFLDNGSGFGVYSRLNLYEAAQRATQIVNTK